MGCQQRRRGSAVATGRKAATWVLGRSHAAEAALMDEGGVDVGKAMGACFLRREHVLALAHLG